MGIDNKELINGAIIFLDKYATNDYTIDENKVIYEKNLRIPNVRGISEIDLSALEIRGDVRVCSDEKLDFKKLPKAQAYWGIGIDNIEFEDAKSKDLKEKGLPKSVRNDFSKRQVRRFFSKIGFCSK